MIRESYSQTDTQTDTNIIVLTSSMDFLYGLKQI